MMKSAENGPHSKPAQPLGRPMTRRILAQSQMRADVVVIAGVSHQDPTQMALTEDDDVIEAFPAD